MGRRNPGAAQLRQFIVQFDKFPKELRQELRPALKDSAAPALAQAKKNAASWSKRIPRATRVAVSFAKKRPGVRLVVNRKKAPHARPYEHGGRGGTFRHPVFGNRDVWVSQRARPFLWPAAKPWMATVDKNVGAAVERAARRLGK